MQNYKYLFPYEMVDKGAKVVIYGYGMVGKQYVQQIKLTGYCKINAIIDRNYVSYNDENICSVEKLKELRYDYVVIAVKEAQYVSEIKNTLYQMNIPEEKIIWLGERYLSKELEKKYCVKDYSLNSGERQVATSLKDIRKDHKNRYELAAKYIDEDVKTILDCFCGVGYGTRYLSEKNEKAIFLGIDGSKEAIDYANKFYSNERVFFMSKVYPFQLPKDAFDVVISFESLEHVEDGNKFLESLISCLKKEGKLLLSIPNEEINSHQKNYNIFHKKHYTFTEVINTTKGKLKLVDWFGQNTAVFVDGRYIEDVDEDDMGLQKNETGDCLVFVFEKIDEGITL